MPDPNASGPGQNLGPVAGPQSSGLMDMLGMSSTYTANAAPGSLYAWNGPGAGQEEANQAAALQQGAAKLDMGAGSGYLGNAGMAAQQGGQSALEQSLYDTMKGNGMSAADLQLQQGQQNTLAAQLAAAKSASGGAGQGTGAYNANQAGAQAGANVNVAAGIQRAQESAQAAGLLGQTLQQQQAANLQAAAQQQQMAMTQAQFQEQQNQINAQTGLGYSAQALQSAEAQGQLGIAQGQNYMGAQQLNVQQTMGNAGQGGSAAGGAMSAGAMLGAAAMLSDARAKMGVQPAGAAPAPQYQPQQPQPVLPSGINMKTDMSPGGGNPTPQSSDYGSSGGGGGGNQGGGPQGFGAGMNPTGGTDSYGNPSPGFQGYQGNAGNGYFGSAYNANGGGYGPGMAGSAYGSSGGNAGQDTTGFSQAYNPANGPSQWNGGWSPSQGAFNPMNDQRPIVHQAFYTPGKYSVSAPPITQYAGQDANGLPLEGPGSQASIDRGGGGTPTSSPAMASQMMSSSPASMGGAVQQLPINPAAQANFPAAATGRAAGVARPGPMVSPTAQQVTSDPSTKMAAVSAGGNDPELAALQSQVNQGSGIGDQVSGNNGMNGIGNPVGNAQQGIQQLQSLQKMANSGAPAAAPTSPTTTTGGGDAGMTAPTVAPPVPADAVDSDEHMKVVRPGGHTVSDAFLDQLSKSEATYTYKDPRNEPTNKPTGGRYLGVMAQAVEQTPTGHTIVKDGPKGKYLEMGPSLSAALAGLGRLNERLDAVESAMGSEENVKSTKAAKKGRK